MHCPRGFEWAKEQVMCMVQCWLGGCCGFSVAVARYQDEVGWDQQAHLPPQMDLPASWASPWGAGALWLAG